MADDEVASRSQARHRLAGIWELSRAGLSPAAQELIDIIAYFPADCMMEEVFVWGSLPATSSIARAFADAESAAAPDSCKCRGCVAQRRRTVVASLAEELVGASLVRRRNVPAHMVFPRQCLIDNEKFRGSEVALSELHRECAWLSVHRVVQEVVRAGHATRLSSSPHPVALAWRASLTCGDDTTSAAAAPHIGLADATSVLPMPSTDAL